MTTTPTVLQHLNSQMQAYKHDWEQVAKRVAAEFCLAEKKNAIDLLPNVSAPGINYEMSQNGWDQEDMTLIAHLRRGGLRAPDLVEHFRTNHTSIETLEAISIRLELAVCALVEVSRCDEDEDEDEALASYWEAVRECGSCEGTAALIGMSALLFDEPLFADFVSPISHSDEDDARQAMRNWLLVSLDHAYDRLANEGEVR